MANYCDENNSCYPSEKHLAKLVGVSDRTIRRCITDLQEKNLIRIEHRLGTSNRYFVSVDTNVLSVRTPTSTNTKEDTKDKYDEKFQKFWKLYPRKVNKYATLQKFKVVLKTYKYEDLMTATMQYAKQIKNSNTEEKFIPHATTWLSQKRFLDDINNKNKKKSVNQIAG